jgi:hypothetical protein
LHLVGGLLYGAAALLLLMNPLAGVLTLTVVLSGLFLVDGAIRVSSATAFEEPIRMLPPRQRAEQSMRVYLAVACAQRSSSFSPRQVLALGACAGRDESPRDNGSPQEAPEAPH